MKGALRQRGALFRSAQCKIDKDRGKIDKDRALPVSPHRDATGRMSRPLAVSYS
ncbi:hypothetical protein [Sphingopyxis sp. RIFCSPHIGHO2_12_FULL_65_19]|uniref:hypothetical protein n=1 Tax=Sphingopyxis sp. RIFCSPHIGHO2_12_FULL_65_19 TaxID=1802172 RepID=UPI0025E5E5C4|nr:hypothetical protein [Sphingopyxis sp. RIFCSPHIGHO2_12_FULL_65_19]